MAKNLPASARDARDVGSIPGLLRSPGVGDGSLSSILAWKTPWTEESGGLRTVHGVTVSWTRLSAHTLNEPTEVHVKVMVNTVFIL